MMWNLFNFFILLSINNLTLIIGDKYDKTVKIKWGLVDTTATIGKLFNYTIAADAFVGNILFYQVLEAGMDELPLWLLWDNVTSSLYGVPDEEDFGPHYVSVTAVGAPINSTHTSLAKDVFTINVRHDTSTTKILDYTKNSHHDDSFFAKECSPEEPLITTSVVLDVPLKTLKSKEKYFFIKKSSELFKFDLRQIRLFRLDYFWMFQKRDPTTMTPTSMEQFYDSKYAKNAVLTLILGCGETFSKLVMKKFERKIVDGRLKSMLNGIDIIDVETIIGKILQRKKRRQANQVNPASGAFGQTTVEVETQPIPTRPAVTVRIQTTTPFRPLYPPTTTARPTHTASRHSSSKRTTTPTTTTERRTTKTMSSSTMTTTTTTTKPTTPRTTTTARPTTTTAAPTAPPTKRPFDERPELKYSLGAITCYRGVLCEKVISKYMFIDKEDGDTTQLRLKLRLLSNTTGENWFHLNSNQTLSGLTMDAGRYEYDLTAYDRSNNGVSDAFDVNVKEKSSDDAFNHEFSMELSTDYKKFHTEKIQFLRRLSSALGDRNVSHVTLVSVDPGSTVVRWSNNSLPTSHCERRIINEILSEMRTATFRDRLGVDFQLKSTQVSLSGSCADEKLLSPPIDGDVGVTVQTIPTTKSPDVAGAKTDNVFVATILPAIIIVVLLLVAIVVACVLYKRNKSTKNSSDESKSEFVSKGVPVIFTDEVDAEKESMAAAPMLLKDEKPPLSPSEFAHTNRNGIEKSTTRGHFTPQQSTMSSTFGKKPLSTTAPLEETELTSRPLLQDFDENPLYRPPPPFEPSRGADGRSPRPKHASPHSREPPPYVPP